MRLLRRICVVVVGAALLGAGARAQVSNTPDAQLITGQQQNYRWNPELTGFGFNPTITDPAQTEYHLGLPSNQLPATKIPIKQGTSSTNPNPTSKYSRDGFLPSPDLTWFYPMDMEGADLQDPGNQAPLGYTLGDIHSSPTVASVTLSSGERLLSVTFGSTTKVNRTIRNTLPMHSDTPNHDAGWDPADPPGSIGRAGDYTTSTDLNRQTGVYQADLDPFSYLNGQNTGAVFSLEGFAGTTEDLSTLAGMGRTYRPLWWYGVRNLPYYLKQSEITAADQANGLQRADDDVVGQTTGTSLSGNGSYEGSPSRDMARFYINASDSAMRAFDYAPDSGVNPDPSVSDADRRFGAETADERPNRLVMFAYYLAPDRAGRKLDDSAKVFDAGAGPVTKGRYDLPERLTDRLYNLSIPGATFGLVENRDLIVGTSAPDQPSKWTTHPLDNRFRQQNGMGPVNSTGTYVHLPSAISYKSRFYNYDTNITRLRQQRKDPRLTTDGGQLREATLSTDQLYIVGSDDGYVYAFDAQPENARRVPTTGGSTLLNTFMGRLVWAFRAAVHAPVLYTGSADSPGLPSGYIGGENPGTPGVVDKNNNAVSTPDKGFASYSAASPILTGPIVSSPVAAEINVPPASVANILAPDTIAGHARMVVYVGSALGRMFCLDAATGQEIWEYKTTPVGVSNFAVNGTKYVDSVRGQPINTSPALGFVAGAVSALRPAPVGGGRLALFFGADDGKVYAVDATDGSPLADSAGPGFNVADSLTGGVAANSTRFKIDHYGWVTYAFEDATGKPLSDVSTAIDNKYGRVTPIESKPLRASVVLRPTSGDGYTMNLIGPNDPNNDHVIPRVDAMFVASPTNQNLASSGDNAGGTIFCVDLTATKMGQVRWVFDRFQDVTRTPNTDFDKDPAKDYTIRPEPFNVTPAYATELNMFNEAEEAKNLGGGTLTPLEHQNVLIAVDQRGRLFPLKTTDVDDTGATITSVNRMYWRAPYQVGTVGADSSNATPLTSSPVVSSPNEDVTDTQNIGPIAGHSYVYLGVNDGIVALDLMAQRSSPLTDVKNNPVTYPGSGSAFTGGEITWGWQVATANVVWDTTTDPNNPGEVFQEVTDPVVTTPAVHAGYLYAGADNGLMYAWSNQLSNYSFDNTGGGGRKGYHGNQQRPPLPAGVVPPGGANVTSNLPLYVDAFQAGFSSMCPDRDFTTPSAFASQSPPPSASVPASVPNVVGVKHVDFQTSVGGMLEWGDPIAVMAWGPAMDNAISQPPDTQSPTEPLGVFQFRVTGPSTSASLSSYPLSASTKQKALGSGSGQGYAREIFYMNPFGSLVPNSLRDPFTSLRSLGNPFVGQLLPPGKGKGTYTVTGSYQPPPLIETTAQGKTITHPAVRQNVTVQATTRWHLANPINITGYFDASGNRDILATPASAKRCTLSDTNPYDLEVDRNGNARIPMEQSIIGDHGSNTLPQPQSDVIISDRSDLPALYNLAEAGAPGSGSDIYLRVKVQPAKMRFIGGAKATYKPLFHAMNFQAFPNTFPSTTPPEPLAIDPNQWLARTDSFWGTGQGVNAFVGLEQPPSTYGEENRSPDYPDIPASTASWTMEATSVTRGTGQTITIPEQQATTGEAKILPGRTSAAGGADPSGLFALHVSVPKYQPANYSPQNVDPSNPNASGVGPGYYTVNPTNDNAWKASLIGWNPSARSANAVPYKADSTTTYWGPLRTQLNSGGTVAGQLQLYIDQEKNYLTKVYVDVNGNGSADTDGGEPYRMFVSGVQVRPTESMRVATRTIDVPQGPEKAIPGGYIPFQFYFDGQAAAVGQPVGSEDPVLFGERNFYAPFAVFNDGNTNLWDLRVDKLDPAAGHLSAPNVDKNELFQMAPTSNWPASGVLKRFNISTTLDPLPIKPGGNPTSPVRGSADDPGLWTTVQKPFPGGLGGQSEEGRVITVRNVFSSVSSNGSGTNAWSTERAPYVDRPHYTGGGLNTISGLPFMTVAIPPGTPPGRYSTPANHLVLFEDSGVPYGPSNRSYDGVLDIDNSGRPLESGVASDAVVTVNVRESHLTDKVSRLRPFLPNTDPGIALSTQFPGVPQNMNMLSTFWQDLAQDVTPAAYRDPVTGDLVSFWSSNRVGYVNSNAQFIGLGGVNATSTPQDKYHILASAMKWQDPPDPRNLNFMDFLDQVVAKDPWGWNYYGGSIGNNFFFPNFAQSPHWFSAPAVDPWLPSAGALETALNLPAGSVAPTDLNYSSPGVITDFHGTDYPPVVFYTGTVGIGSQARSAIFYAPVKVDQSTGAVTPGGPIATVGMISAAGPRTLDPVTPKFSPRPFLITSGGDYSASGDQIGTAYLNGEKVNYLGVAWFGGSPGAWKLYVSTLDANNNEAQWTTRQLPLPDGVVNALHPSVYYHQQISVDSSGNPVRQGILETAFTGYSRNGRSPDIYVTRYIALTEDASGANPKLGNFQMMGFARRGGDPNNKAENPLEPLLRVAGEPRPVYRSHWANWYGRRSLGTIIYWFQKPVPASGEPNRWDDYQLHATFTMRWAPGSGTGFVQELHADSGAAPHVTAFVDAGSGTVRFTTDDPVNNPAPLSRPYMFNGRMVQDYIYAAMNPYAMRVTTDDNVTDAMPQIWLDETHDVLSQPGNPAANDPGDQPKTNVPLQAGKPLSIRRDRLWVLWRRGPVPEGATAVSSLFYTTFRMGVDLGQDLNKIAGTSSDNADVRIPLDGNYVPQVTVTPLNNGQPIGPFLVDAQNGRLFFSTANDGEQVQVSVNGVSRGHFVIGWIPEDPSGPVRYGTDPNHKYLLPLGQWTEPRTVPISQQDNDSQPWMFKDPFSDLVPGTPEYYQRGNNAMWLFWASTRPAQAMGTTASAPGIAASGVDPYYYNTGIPGGSLMYSGSASDVYYTSISPDFQGH